MPEKPPQLSDFEADGVLKPLAEVTHKIAHHIANLGHDVEVQKFNESLLILCDESSPITLDLYNEIAEEYATSGVVISFNEDEQIIRVRPFRN